MFITLFATCYGLFERYQKRSKLRVTLLFIRRYLPFDVKFTNYVYSDIRFDTATLRRQRRRSQTQTNSYQLATVLQNQHSVTPLHA